MPRGPTLVAWRYPFPHAAIPVEARRKLGPLAPDAPLFPSVQDMNEPWSRHHARKLLEKAEKRAALEPIDGGDFYPYRRAWATARKRLPIGDVAATGGWLSVETLQRCDRQIDPATMLAVVSERKRVRDPKVKRNENGRGKPSKKSSRAR